MTNQDSLESRMQGKLARPVWGWGPGAIPGPTPLFVGNVEAGERSAMMMTLVSSAKRHDLDVCLYIKDVLDQLLAGCTNYASLLPDQWKKRHPEAVRQYRQEERRDKADRKQYNAARRRLARA